MQSALVTLGTGRATRASEAPARWPAWLFPGWYVAAPSSDVKRATIKPIQIAGHDLVVYRTTSGQPVVMDRYCVHNGTSLAVGQVQGERIRCAYHHWAYGPDGQCEHVPGCAKVPPRARMRSYHVTERIGLIWVYAGEGTPKRPPLPDSELKDQDGWMRVRITDLGAVETSCRDIFENTVDTAHLRPLHQVDAASDLLQWEATDDAFWTKFGAYQSYGRPIAAGGLAGVFAPSVWHTILDGVFMSERIKHQSAWTLTAQPVGPFETRLFSVIHIRGDRHRLRDRLLGEVIDRMWSRGIRQDVWMWNNKIVQEAPVLSAADGPIMKWRQWWAAQEARARADATSTNAEPRAPSEVPEQRP